LRWLQIVAAIREIRKVRKHAGFCQ